MKIKAVNNIVHSGIAIKQGDIIELGDEINMTEKEFKQLSEAGAIAPVLGEFEIVDTHADRDNVDKIVDEFNAKIRELETINSKDQETIESLQKELNQTKIARDEIELALLNARKQIETLSVKKSKSDKDSGK